MIKSNITIHNPDLSQALWENVPVVIHKAMQMNQTNIQAIKRWTDGMEAKLIQINDADKAVKDRLTSMDADRESVRELFQTNVKRIEVIGVKQETTTANTAACIGSLLDTLNDFAVQMGSAFGKELPEEEVTSSSRLTQHSKSPDFEQFREESQGLQERLREVLEGFRELGEWRRTMDKQNDKVKKLVGILETDSSNTRQRLLAWRETLLENSNAVHALGSTLTAVQEEVRALQISQVTREQIDETVGSTKVELETKLSHTQDYVTSVKNDVELHTLEMHNRVNELQAWTGERIDDHSEKVAQLLESSLNPINAFLNRLRVKVDSLRADVDKLEVAVPVLGSRLDESKTEFEVAEAKRMESDEKFRERLSQIDDSLAIQQSALSEESVKNTRSFEKLHLEIGGGFENIYAALDKTESDLRITRDGDMPKFTADLVALEEKVARWVHANPLPLKISEARLFSLERRLADEMDARLELETTLETKLSYAAGQYAADPKVVAEGDGSARTSGCGELPVVSKPATAPSGLNSFRKIQRHTVRDTMTAPHR